MTLGRLREVQSRRRDDPDVMTLLREIKRLRETIRLAHTYYEATHKSWREEVGDRLVALERMKGLLGSEPVIIERDFGSRRDE